MLQIREAVPADFERIWPIFHAVVYEARTYAYSPDLKAEEAKRLWFAQPGVVFVACEDDRIVGTYRLGPNFPTLGDHIANAGYMVDVGYRCRGVASALCEHSLRQAAAAGFSAMQVNYVVSSNDAAIRLWQRFGFVTVGTIPKAFRHAEVGSVDVLVMYRAL